MNSTPILIQSDIVTLRAVSNGNYIFSSAATSLGPNLTRSTRTRRTASEKTPLKQNPAEVIAFGSVMMFGRGRGRRQSSFATLFVGFSDDRRFFVPGLVFLVFFVLIIIVVGVSRRPRIVSDGDEAPVGPTGENFLGHAWGHVGSCLDVVTFALSPTGTQASTVMSTALRRSNVAVSNLRPNSRAWRQESPSSVRVGGRAISAYLSRYLALAGSQKLSGRNCAITLT